MDLILWRHAEAEEADVGADDLARALTPKGERQAERMAEWLNRRLAHSTRTLVSPALRCQQTAKALGLALALRRQRAREVVSADIGFFGFGVAPEDQIHARPVPSLFPV